MLFRQLLKVVVREGNLGLIDHKGRRYDYGRDAGPRPVIRLHDPTLDWTLPLNPPVRFAEAYMDGSITIEEGTLEELIQLFACNYDHLERHPVVQAGYRLSRHGRRLKQYNPIGKAQRNVAHHYDLSEKLYRLFLDEDMQYSCAYFVRPDMTLEEAQKTKREHIAAKLHLDRPGLKVLDIGSGWGGLGLHLAKAHDCRVTGVTLSVEQHRVSRERAEDQQLGDRTDFLMKDYRELDETFDRVVSVGMFEHVGKRNYDEYFSKVHDLLAEDGVAMIHTIGRVNEPGPINPFIRKYIFPGADIPTLSEIMPSVERSGLLVADVEVLRLHYAKTLKHWRERFEANRERIRQLYDERFCRMWELYLIGCEYGFRLQGLVVFQVQLTRRIDALPLTRDYIYDGPLSVRPMRAAE